MAKARIYKPSKSATQSGRGRASLWVLEYEPQKQRQPEALMGWTSALETQDQVRLKFHTLENAQAYAREQGLDFTIEPEHIRKIKPRNYGDNFKYVPVTDSKS